MKRTIVFALLLAVCRLLSAQSCSGYSLTIHGDFESECVYEFKDLATDEYPGVLVACKGSTVKYTALTDAAAGSVSAYLWEVLGDSHHSADGDELTVDWGTGETGFVVVSIVTPGGDTCTASRMVKLVDRPAVAALTVPSYILDQYGNKVIYVCRGGSVDFADASDAGASDIAGYGWTADCGGESTTATFSLTGILYDCTVRHRVYNNCGCYDEESFKIEVLSGENLAIDCYGTVCGGDKVTYRVLNPTTCQQYMWYAEGGTIVGGQGTGSPTVQWGFPGSGFGVLGIDGELCGGVTCPTLMSVKVPVISGGLEIVGQSEVCLGESVLFSLPLFGSTEYTWTVTHGGVTETKDEKGHEMRHTFDEAGSYTVQATYGCSFLGCGPYRSAPLTVTVRPVLAIDGLDEVCPGGACTLGVVQNVAAVWTVYDLGNGNSPVATGSGATFSPVLSHSGRYLVTAEAGGYCGPATHLVTVRQPPAAPTVAEMNPANRHAACVNGGIMLSGVPSDLRYTFLWEPESSTAVPSEYCGDSVTVLYGSEVSGVRVYTYDRETGCLSDGYYLHSVVALAPEALTLPTSITVCPGTHLHWGPPEVPDQEADGMLYEWKMDPDKQYCATVVGDHKRSGVDIQVNEVSAGTVFDIILERRWCGSSRKDTVTVTAAANPVTLAISGPDTVCMGSEATFSASCNPSGGCSGYSWDIAHQSHGGNPVSHTFTDEGDYGVMVECNPYTYCDNESYYSAANKVVHVRHQVMTSVIDYNRTSGVLSLLPPLGAGYTYAWYYNGTTPGTSVSLGTNPTAQYCGVGNYSCTVTETATGCSKTLTEWCDSIGDPQTLALTAGDYDWCTRTITLTAPTPPQFHETGWTVTGGGYTIETRGTRNHIADVTIRNVGSYTVTARDVHPDAQNRRWRHTFTVPLIPSIGFVPQCTSVKLNNESRYLYGDMYIYIKVVIDGGSDEEIFFRAAQKTYTYSNASLIGSGLHTLTFYFTGYRMPGQNKTTVDECLLGSVEIGNNGATVSISTSNQFDPPGTYTTCDNTPLRLTASMSDGSHIWHSAWTFSDGSSLNASGASVYHTFEATQHSLTVTVTDVHGCQRSKTENISSANNSIDNGDIAHIINLVCPYVSPYQDVLFTPDGIAISYRWTNDPNWPNNPFQADHSDNYRVLATTVNNCQQEAEEFVPFLPCPTARIYAKNFICCVGDDVRLHGALPAGSQVSYSWVVLNGNSVEQTGTTPDIVFHASSTGQYTVTLTITDNNSYCSSTDSKTITVQVPPAAPTLTFSTPHCIGNPPVELTASGYNGTVFWSNGDTGPTARYYYAGPLSAWYYDPSDGCPSHKAYKTIDQQPDFDALLTGCYERCKKMPNSLPVYSLVPAGQDIDWVWTKDNAVTASGSGSFTPPLALPLAWTGDYTLGVTYDGPSCTEWSPHLRIDGKEECDCDSLSITAGSPYYQADANCNISCRVEISITNGSHSVRCIDTVALQETENVRLVYSEPTGRILQPGNTYSFLAEFYVQSLTPPLACFTLRDTCLDCTKEFCVDITPEVACRQQVQDNAYHLSVRNDLSNRFAGYLEFDIPSTGVVYDCHSNPPMVLSYTTGSGMVHGLLMLDRGVLSQLADNNGDVVIEYLACQNGTLCWYYVLVPAGSIISLLDNVALTPSRNGLSDVMPQLQPNPTTGWVEVIGAAGEVEALTVYDMQGRRLADCHGVWQMDVSTLAAGTYIVRVDSRDKDGSLRTDYLKMVKK